MADAYNTTIELPDDLHAPRLARRFVAKHSDSLPADLVADAELLVSELVTNAVRHGRPAITLRVALRPPGIGVAVDDEGAERPQITQPAPPTSQPGGRGLLIMQAVARASGVAPHPDGLPGKTVWFELESADYG